MTWNVQRVMDSSSSCNDKSRRLDCLATWTHNTDPQPGRGKKDNATREHVQNPLQKLFNPGLQQASFPYSYETVFLFFIFYFLATAGARDQVRSAETQKKCGRIPIPQIGL